MDDRPVDSSSVKRNSSVLQIQTLVAVCCLKTSTVFESSVELSIHQFLLKRSAYHSAR